MWSVAVRQRAVRATLPQVFANTERTSKNDSFDRSNFDFVTMRVMMSEPETIGNETNECYQGDGFMFCRRRGSAAANPDRELRNHEIHMENAEPAAISLFPAGTTYSGNGGQTDELVLELAPSLLENSLGDRPLALELQRSENIQDPRIQRVMFALLEDLRDGCPAANTFAVSLVTAISSHLVRRYSVRREMSSRRVMPRARLKRVLAYIDEKADENLRLADLAKAAGMSVFHFAKLFKQTTGQSPHRYALARRMEKAKQLLKQEEVTVLEVSARTGFVDQRHFAKVFRRFTGFTPTAYRAAV
jgi:AraC family transcriptional regulator